MMNGHALEGGSPAKATVKPPPSPSASPKPTSRSETACANEFHAACNNAEKSTANTIDKVTQQAPRPDPTRSTFIRRRCLIDPARKDLGMAE